MTAVFEFLASSWIPAVLLLALTLHLRSRSDSWFAPSCFFGLFWFFFLAASLMAVDHRVPGLGTWALVSLIVAVQLGSVLGENREEQRSAAEQPGLQLLTRLRVRHATAILTLAGLAACAYFIWSSLELFGQGFDLISILQMAAKWTLLRYDGFIDPWPLRLAAIWVYPAALVGGILLPLSRSRPEKMLAGLSLLPSLLLTALSGGRAAFLVGLAGWLGGYLSTRVIHDEGTTPLLGSKTVTALAGLSVSLLLLFVMIDTFRGASGASDVRDLSFGINRGQIVNYMFGTPAAFAGWAVRGERGPLGWGGLTFPGAFDLLGLRPRVLGTYLDSVQTFGSEGTNIFTIFRGLIEDFSFPGALMISAAWGFVSARAYSGCSLRSGPLLVLAGFYTVALMSPLYCIFGFNGPVFTWVVAGLVLSWKMNSPSAGFGGQECLGR